MACALALPQAVERQLIRPWNRLLEVKPSRYATPPPLPQNDINVEAAFYTIARDVKQRLNATLQATGPLPTQTVRIGFDGSSGGAKKAGVAGCC